MKLYKTSCFWSSLKLYIGRQHEPSLGTVIVAHQPVSKTLATRRLCCAIILLYASSGDKKRSEINLS